LAAISLSGGKRRWGGVGRIIAALSPPTMTYIKVEEMHLPPRSFKRNQIIAAASHGV